MKSLVGVYLPFVLYYFLVVLAPSKLTVSVNSEIGLSLVAELLFWLICEKNNCLSMAAFDNFLEFVLSIVAWPDADSQDIVAGCSVSSITSSADLVLAWFVDNLLAAIMVQSFVAVVTLKSSMDKISSDNNWSSTSGMLLDTLVPESIDKLCRCVFELKKGNLLANVERLWTDERLDVSASSLCIRYDRSLPSLALSTL